MKFKSKTIVVLEMDEHEMELVMEAIDTVGVKSKSHLREKAARFIQDYQGAVAEFERSRMPKADEHELR
jgi:hypothetical protein